MTTKLTLSADAALIKEAKLMASARHTSVSAMFARFLTAMKQVGEETASPPPGPITRAALGLVRLRADHSERLLLQEALADKYQLQ